VVVWLPQVFGGWWQVGEVTLEAVKTRAGRSSKGPSPLPLQATPRHDVSMPTTWRTGHRSKAEQSSADPTTKLEDAAPLGDVGAPVAVSPAVVGSSESRDRRLAALEAIDGTERQLSDSIIPASSALDVLLDLWSIVHEVDRVAAVPLQDLMTILVRRSYTTASELVPVCARTRTLLMSGQ
jgi:hypothetical protein